MKFKFDGMTISQKRTHNKAASQPHSRLVSRLDPSEARRGRHGSIPNNGALHRC